MSNKQPTYHAFHVTDAGEGKKGFWTRIGAAWRHEDGKGFNVQLDLFPTNGGRIVIREAEKPE